MRSVARRVISLLFFLFFASCVTTDEPEPLEETKAAPKIEADIETVIALVEQSDTSDDPRLEAVSEAVENQCRSLIAAMSEYRLYKGEEIPTVKNAKSLGIDNLIIFQSQIKKNQVDLEIAAWDVHQERTLISMKDATEDYLKIFQLTEKLLMPVAEKFYGSHLRFGTLQFSPKGDFAWSIRVNGDNLSLLENQLDLITGLHQIEILNDNGVVILSEKIAINEGEKTTLYFYEEAGSPIEMIEVKGDRFTMGSDEGKDNEQPEHIVSISSFLMSETEITQGQWASIMGTTISQLRDIANPGWSLMGEGVNYPVYYVSWYDAAEFCNKLSLSQGLTPCYSGTEDKISCDFSADGYRLPTEAEWEYAAQGGRKGKDTLYAGSDNIDDVSWYVGNSQSISSKVAAKEPNELGLYDMSGNMWEWCQDRYDENFYSKERGIVEDPLSDTGQYRLLRGGCFNKDEVRSRVTDRAFDPPGSRYFNYGFRIVRPAKG